MPRGMYTIPITNTAGTAGTGVSVAIDIAEITAASGKPFVLHRVVLGQYSDPGDAQAELLSFVIKRGVGHTPGSGGPSVTPAKHNTGDAAASTTARLTNNTQATGGTITTTYAEPWNVQAGIDYCPLPEDRIVFNSAEACIISITAPADALTMEGSIIIEELF